jgi:hypothetical protein
MAILLKPRSNKQGLVDTTADLANVEGRENYTVLVKDTGLFEWVPTGTVDGTNIIAAKKGYWSRVIQSGDVVLPYTPENIANKSLSVTLDGSSDTKYPSVKATKTYADSLVTGLLDDRGNFTPSLTSPGAWPTTGGSGTAGAIMKGDIWFCSASGFMGTTAVVAGASFRAIVDSPGQTAANWNVLSAGAISITTPNLQEVTTAGSTTSNAVTVNNTITSNSSISATNNITSGQTSVGAISASNGSVSLVQNAGEGPHLAIYNKFTLSTARVKAGLINADRQYELPDDSGILALTSQIAEPYKVYTASFTFESGNPVVTVYRNTIGNGSADGVNDIAWVKQFFWFDLNMTGSTAFPAGKTWIQSASYIGNAITYTVYGSRISNTQIRIQGRQNSDNAIAASFGVPVFFEIRVYP